MSTLSEMIKEMALEIHPRLVEIRRHLHMHPELSFEEKNTSIFLQEVLSSIGVPFTTGWAGHGIVATIDVGQSETIMLRADMDALPIQETSTHDYISTVQGCMHACGHDVHMTSMVGAIMILHTLREYLTVNVKCIFQPGEEKLPGGASIMIQEGVLDAAPSKIIAQHVFPSLEVGKVGIRSGLYMASADEIYIHVRGRGGHAAMPHENVDTVLIAAQIIVALQAVVARQSDPTIPAVLSFGKINSVGGATNVIPDVVKIEGTLRAMDEKWRFNAHKSIREVAKHTAQAYGGEVDVVIEVGYPCLTNHPEVTSNVRSRMIAYLGEENVVDIPMRMTAEDFSFYTLHVPGCFYRLGTRNTSKGIVSPVHTSTFDIDEDALVIGAGLMAYLCFEA
jgi:amidohydrolase